MIPEIFVEAWHKKVKWQTAEQVEQDLIIKKALINLYNNPHIKETLIFRGGTALNKLFIKPAARYSEDIDLVQKNSNPIGLTIDAIRNVLQPWLGEPKRILTQRSAKLIYRYETIAQTTAKLKIEINTTEHLQVLPLRMEEINMESEWFNGTADIVTYELDELIATKLRALYQRRKGRDLFDLWYVAKNDLVNLDKVLSIFAKYCSYNEIQISGEEFIKNLENKKNHRDFKTDMKILLPSKLGWDFETAYQFVLDNIVSKLP